MNRNGLAPKIGAIMGGPETDLISDAISKVSRELNKMGGGVFGDGVSIVGMCFEVGGSFLPVAYVGVRTCRLTKDGRLSCSVGIPENLWVHLNNREIVQLVAKMTGEAIALMVKHVVKRAPDFDGAAYLSDALAILGSIDESSLPPTDNAVHRALKAIITSEGGTSLAVGKGMSVSLDPDSESGLSFTRIAETASSNEVKEHM
jgi:hypothetical protein